MNANGLFLVIIRDYIKSGRYKTVITTPVMIVCELLCDVHFVEEVDIHTITLNFVQQ